MQQTIPPAMQIPIQQAALSINVIQNVVDALQIPRNNDEEEIIETTSKIKQLGLEETHTKYDKNNLTINFLIIVKMIASLKICQISLHHQIYIKSLKM